MAHVTVVTMSEFGRRVKENASGGTDHGHGNCMFLLGGGVNGGKVYGDWPGLAAEQLYGPGRPGDHHRLPHRALRGGGGAWATRGRDVFPGFTAGASLGICR